MRRSISLLGLGLLVLFIVSAINVGAYPVIRGGGGGKPIPLKTVGCSASANWQGYVFGFISCLNNEPSIVDHITLGLKIPSSLPSQFCNRLEIDCNQIAYWVAFSPCPVGTTGSLEKFLQAVIGLQATPSGDYVLFTIVYVCGSNVYCNLTPVIKYPLSKFTCTTINVFMNAIWWCNYFNITFCDALAKHFFTPHSALVMAEDPLHVCEICGNYYLLHDYPLNDYSTCVWFSVMPGCYSKCAEVYRSYYALNTPFLTHYLGYYNGYYYFSGLEFTCNNLYYSNVPGLCSISYSNGIYARIHFGYNVKGPCVYVTCEL